MGVIRTRYDLIQEQLERLLNGGPKTVVRSEGGTVCQNAATNTLMRLLRDVPTYQCVYTSLISSGKADMAISIKDPETDRLARELAAATGESLTDAIREAVRDRLERHTKRGHRNVSAEVRRIQERLARLPILDARTPDEILGYDDHGLPN